MLPTLKKTIKVKNTPGFGGGVPFEPSSLPLLQVWYKPENISGFFNPTCTGTWTETYFPEGMGGSVGDCIPPPTPPNQRETLNGLNVLALNNAHFSGIAAIPATCFVSGVQTFIGILKLTNTGTKYCHVQYGNLPATIPQISVRNNGNKLRVQMYADNSQLVQCDSVSNLAGSGWFIFAFKADVATAKNMILYETGNTITSTNALMNSWTKGGGQTRYLININTFAAGWTGGLGEFIAYSDLKSTSDINKVAQYLAAKYGLSWINV